jgi:MFS family permease
VPPDQNLPVTSRATLATVLARPQFLLLTIGQTVSQLGDRLHNMALLALVDAAAQSRTTGVEVAKIGVVFLAPTVFAPIVGALVDRMNKRTTMIVCDLLRALTVACVPWLYHATGFIWPAYVVAFLVGLLGVFFNAAKMALIPDLVAEHQLMPANAALATIGRFATVAGIVGGGVMVSWTIWDRVGWTGYEAGFYLDSASYSISVITLVVIMMLSRVHASRQPSEHPFIESAEVVRDEVRHIRGDMLSTFTLIRSHHGLRFVFLMVIVLGSLAASIYAILTAAALDILDVGTRGVGFLGGLLAGGMIVGSLIVGFVGTRFDKRWLMILGCLVMGLFMIGGSFAFTYAVLLPISFLGGTVLAPVMVAMDTLLHEWAPARSRALVFSTRDLVLGATFITFASIVGFGLALLEPWTDNQYAVAMRICGILVSAAAVSSALTQRHVPAEQARAA